MIKLSDIIKSGGGNAKINRFINRYVLSKKEKKDIVNEIKTKGSSSGSSIKYVPKYYNIEKDVSDEIKGFIGTLASTVKQVYNGRVSINPSFNINDPSLTLIGFSFNPIHTEVLGVEKYIDSIEDLIAIMESEEGDLFLQNIKRITEEEYYKID